MYRHRGWYKAPHSEELSLPIVVPVDFMTAGRTNDVLQSFCLHQGTFLHGESSTMTHCLQRHWEERWVAGLGRVGQAQPELAVRSLSPLGHLPCLHHTIRAGSSLTLPGWSCGAGQWCLACLALFDLAERTNSVFLEPPVTASRYCSHQYENKRRIKLRWVK